MNMNEQIIKIMCKCGKELKVEINPDYKQGIELIAKPCECSNQKSYTEQIMCSEPDCKTSFTDFENKVVKCNCLTKTPNPHFHNENCPVSIKNSQNGES